MSDSYSVKARLSATDSGFSSTLKSAIGTLGGFQSKINGLTFGMLSGVGSQLFSGITSGIRGIVSEIDSSNASWKTFESNLSMLGDGWNSSKIDAAKKDLQEFAQQSVYSSSDMATTFAQLAAVGVQDTGELVKAFGGLAAAAENPQQAMKTLSQQATQMAAKPSVAWADFKLMLEQTPAGIAAVAREMNMSTSELVTAVQDGEVSTTAFFEAIKKAGGAGTELAELATEAKTIGQAMDGLKETIGNKLTPAFDYLSGIGIKAVEGISAALAGINGESIKAAVVGWVEDAKPYWESFKNAAVKVWQVIGGVAQKLAPAFAAIKSTVGGALKTILDSIGKIDAKALVDKIGSGIEKAKPYWEAVKSVILAVAGAIAKVIPYIKKVGAAIGNFFLNNSETIAKFIPYIAGAIAAFKGFKIVKSIFGKASSVVDSASSAISGGVSKVSQIIGSLGNMFRDLGAGISMAARGIGEGIESVFVGIGKALKLANPVNILALGAAIAIVAAGFTLLATQGDGIATILGGIGSVVESVGAALSGIISTAITAIANALVILAPVMPIIAQSLVMLTPLVYAFGAAFSMVALAVGDAISKIVVALGEGVARIVEALTPVVEIISTLITDIVQIWADAIVRITEVLAPLVPVFVEAFTEISRIVSEAIVAIVEALAPYIPNIQKIVEATSLAIQSICEAFTTLVEQIVPVVESVTELIKQLGDSLTEILGGASELVTAFGDTISEVVESIGNAISGIIDSVAGVFESMGEAALNAGLGFEHLANGIKTIVGLNLLDMAASMTAVALSLGDLVRKSSGIGEAGSGMSKLASGLVSVAHNGSAATMTFAMLASVLPRFVSVSNDSNSTLLQMGATLTTFSRGAKKAGSAADDLADGLMSMSEALDDTGRAAKEAGKFIGTGFNTAMKTGLAKAPSVARTALSAVNTALRSGRSGAYSAGAYISQGFAQGMKSQLALIRSAAAQMAAAADAAVRAKARINSPSKVAIDNGEYWGSGLAVGLKNMRDKVWKAAEDLFTVPNVATPRLAMAYAGEMSSEYEYYANARYTIQVPLNVDGREVAKATATYTQEAIEKQQTRENRKLGKV